MAAVLANAPEMVAAQFFRAKPSNRRAASFIAGRSGTLGFVLRRGRRFKAIRKAVHETIKPARAGQGFEGAKADVALRVRFNPGMTALIPFAELSAVAVLGPYRVRRRVFFRVHGQPR
jgi:hypothetical protein